jgi:pyridoxal phosphate enzyme (YggS family)
MSSELQRLRQLRERIADACRSAGRDPAEVRVLAVSKQQPPELIRRFFSLGQRAFGENRLQEALAKQAQLADLDIEWHFIGPVQSNKTRELAERFQWVQSVDRETILRRLSAQRPADLQPLNVCLQVNVDDESQKTGLAPVELPSMAEQASSMPNVRLRGLMAIPRLSPDERRTRDSFRRMRLLYEQLLAAGHQLDTLSLGMSGDLELAIAEGSTMVRIGTDLLGPRTPKSTQTTMEEHPS